MKELKSKVKSILREGAEASLPVFDKNNDGEYELVDHVEISTIGELKEYMKAYSEIAAIIKRNFQRQISAIYRNALSGMILKTTDGKSSSKVLDNLGSSFTDTDFDLQRIVGSELSERTVLRLLKTEPFAGRRFKPGTELINLMKVSDDDGLIILPKMSENGVIAVPDENLGSISLQYNRYSLDAAEEIKSYMLDAAYSIEDPELSSEVVERINTLFRSTQMADDLGEYNFLKRLASVAIELVGVDLSAFNKRKYNRGSKNKTLAANANGTATTTSKVKEDLSETEKERLEREVRQIIIDGRNLIHQQKSGDTLTTIISPEDGDLSYKLKLVGSIAVLSQNSEEDPKAKN